MSLGTVRFVLAMFVAFSHLWMWTPHGYAAYAVWGFFVLSGYLMTRVLRERYGFSAAGLRDFAVNRFLRIFPAYYLASLLAIGVCLIAKYYGVSLQKLNPEFGLPNDPWGWLFPITLMPLFDRQLMPIAVANALGIEVGFYLLMPLMAFRRWIAWLFFGVGIYFLTVHGFEAKSFGVRYATFWPCSLAFALGALAAHYAEAIKSVSDWRWPALLWGLNSLIWFRYGWWPWTIGLYVSAVMSMWLVVALADQTQARWDKWLGDLSYPVYLLHTVVGGFFFVFLTEERNALFCTASIAATLVLSHLFVVYVDRPLQKTKRKPKAVEKSF